MTTGTDAAAASTPFRAFLSYRKDDSEPLAHGLRRVLDAAFGEGTTFAHFASIKPGQQWESAIRAGVTDSDCLLALIGPEWIGRTNEYAAERRLDEAEDWVAREIAMALEFGKPIIPILIDAMPELRPNHLPSHLQGLAAWQAFRLDTKRLLESAADLITTLRKQAWRQESRPPTARSPENPLANTKSPHATIDADCVQAQINAAAPGERIELPGARVLGTLRIRQGVRLTGVRGTILEAVDIDLSSKDDRVEIRNVRIRSRTHQQEAVAIRGTGQVELTNSTIDASDFDFGIAAYDGRVSTDELTIRRPRKAGVAILGNVDWRSLGTRSDGLRIEGSAGNGVEIASGATGAQIAMRCCIRNCEAVGIVAWNGSLRITAGSRLVSNQVGIDLVGKARALIRNTRIARSEQSGVRVASDERVEITRCVVEHNRRNGIEHPESRHPGRLVISSTVRSNGGHGILYHPRRTPRIESACCYGNGTDVTCA